MKARLNQWGFNVLAFCLVVLAYVANLMPEPASPGRHRGVGRATRASHRQLRADRDIAAYKRRTFVELSKKSPKTLVWDGDVGLVWMDEFDMPPVPQRRFRALAPRALAAAAIDAREALRRDQEALRRDQEAIAGDFNRAMEHLALPIGRNQVLPIGRPDKDQEVS